MTRKAADSVTTIGIDIGGRMSASGQEQTNGGTTRKVCSWA